MTMARAPVSALQGTLGGRRAVARYRLRQGAKRVDFSARWFHEFGVQNRIPRRLDLRGFSFRPLTPHY